MIPKEAIEKAIEGGWTANHYIEDAGSLIVKVSVDGFVSLYHNDTKFPDLSAADIALDPTLWQALGKALGWDVDMIRCIP